MPSTKKYLSRAGLALAMLALARLTSCTSVAEPPTKDDLRQLAAQDSKQYVGKPQCLTEFRWPVTTTVETDGAPDWYVHHDELNKLVTAGLATRRVREDKVDVGDGQTATRSRLVFELTPEAASLEQVHNDQDTGGNPATVLCFGTLAWDGNVSLEPVKVENGSLENLLFHEQEYDEYPAYRQPGNDVVVSRLSYALQFSPNAYTKAHGKELASLIDSAFRVRKVYVDVSNAPKGGSTLSAGKGWVVGQSHPGRGD